SHNSHVVGTTRFSISKKATHKMKIYGNMPPMTYTPWEFSLNVPVHHEQLDYQRGALDTLTTQNTLFLNANASYRLLRGEGTHDLRVSASFDQRSVELLNCLGWRDDSQPLIVRLGNPDLKHYAATKVSANYYNHNGHGHQQSLHLGTTFNYDHRNVAQSVQYAPTTGVYTYKPMNVSGAYLFNGNFDFSRTLDSKHYWSIQTNADASLHHSVDHAMLAGETESHENTVNTLILHDNAYIQYDHNKLNLRAIGDIRWRHSEGKMLDFDVLNAFDYQYALSGRYTIPGINMTISADATMYSRRGYGSSNLNTDDFVINASLSQPFLKGKLIARIEAFDLLHQLSNTQYEVNAQGRTITWYRSLPHYVMAHIVYHWNKNPKKAASK
ncbi:MAG: TolC family protein, partial [Bacteroidales bacterium]|nr:TolC family protein [Bacteroidales bacterium]